MSESEERKNRRIGLIVSISLHTAVLLLFIFLVAWREPNPPLPEYGIELNFGTDDAGSGEIQPTTPVTNTDSDDDAKPEDASVTDPVEESFEDQSSSETDVTEEMELDEIVQQDEQREVYDDEQSYDVVEDKPLEDIPTEETREESKLSSDESKMADMIEEINEEGAEGEKGQEETTNDINQGDKKDEVGDQGSETGKIDDRALYGRPGGEGGSSLDLAGWTWDFKPDPKDTSNESGRIVFEIRIDDQGEIISIRTLERTVSPSVEIIYKKEVERITFSKTDNLPPAPVSTGKITFIITAK